ncbi:MAG: phosphatidate cytidylyltransferase [Betaproteobacteria bacterium]|nr:phosphatidate cytidylyltransferase [Betaproteobacteria bacterium]
MLGQRVITAVALLAVLLPAIFLAPTWVWGAVSLAFLSLAAAEWVSLLPAAPRARAPGMAAGAAGSVAAPAAPTAPAVSPLPVTGSTAWLPHRGWPLAAWLALAGALVLVWRQAHPWPAGVLATLMAALTGFWLWAGPVHLRRHDAHGAGQVLIGLLLFGCWLALFELRQIGAVALLSGMAVVWVADIAAYFSGRAFGRRKLAPAISPGKTWEGVYGALVAVVVLALALAWLGSPAWLRQSQPLPAVLVQGIGALGAALVLAGIVALSIVGDLHESLLKRQSGVKDSSRLLPGHGGVLDRIDALIPTMPVVLLIYELLR